MAQVWLLILSMSCRILVCDEIQFPPVLTPYITRRVTPSNIVTIFTQLFFDHANQVNSILQQQAQLILNQQKLDEVKKLAKATKAAIKQNKAALGGSMGSSSGKGSGYGTIGDLRYRN